jgi:hypothetical protein
MFTQSPAVRFLANTKLHAFAPSRNVYLPFWAAQVRRDAAALEAGMLLHWKSKRTGLRGADIRLDYGDLKTVFGLRG